MAILVVDIMHGLEPQTKESLQLLRNRKCPFLIALNKIDRLYGWESNKATSVKLAIQKQKSHVQDEFEKRFRDIQNQLNAEALNVALYWDNPDPKYIVSVAPTSAITSEGVADLLYSMTYAIQLRLGRGIVYDDKNFQCAVLERKTIEGLGAAIDVILMRGKLQEGDKIAVCGLYGPIITHVKALLTPRPLKEFRIKSEFIHNKIVFPAQGVRVVAHGLDDAVAGTNMLKIDDDTDPQVVADLVMTDMHQVFKCVNHAGIGVYVMASTLGSLEALLQFLQDSAIPVVEVNIGTVRLNDIKRCAVMRERNHPEYALLLAFDVPVDPEAALEAKKLGVKIFQADIIYHLFDSFKAHLADYKQQQKLANVQKAIFPCELEIIPDCIFNKKDPLVMGVRVLAGKLKLSTPLAVPEKNVTLGIVAGIEKDKKPIETATPGMEVCLKIIGEPQVTYGRHFEHPNKIYSKINRTAIDVLKEHFRDQMSKDDWVLVIHLKKIFQIP